MRDVRKTIATTAGFAVARFHIIDQSLCQHGGHHFDYVNCMARVAFENGFETFVASNRRFRPTVPGASKKNDLSNAATVLPTFCNTTYQRESWLAGLRHLKRAEIVYDKSVGDKKPKPHDLLSASLSWLKLRRGKRKRRRLIAQFARDLHRYFHAHGESSLTQEDHVFFTTVSELEMMGLAIFLANSPWTQPATWHLQFHYNLFDGRTPEFELQSTVLEKVRGCFLAAFARIPDHDLLFYCTSEELVRQYEQLNVAKFTRLPYPINRNFAPQFELKSDEQSVVANQLVKHRAFESTDAPRPSMDVGTGDAVAARSTEESSFTANDALAAPVRMVCPGELRREKGMAVHLQKVIDDLWAEYFGSGKLQVAVQRPRQKLLRKNRLQLQLPEGECDSTNGSAIEYLQHPLSEVSYSNFIRNADFGLLLYDSRAYFSRRAGVLGELLACGKPVIVPAGCWLAHQIQDCQFEHIESLMLTMNEGRRLVLSDLSFDSSNAPLSGGLLSFNRERHPFSAEVETLDDETILVVSFDWHHPTKSGVDARIECRTSESKRDNKTNSVQIVGHRRNTQQTSRCRAIFRIGDGRTLTKLSFRNAYFDSMATIKNLVIRTYRAPDPEKIPLGRVGIISPTPESASESVDEMMRHLDHFKQSATSFSHGWFQRHDPAKTLECLVGYLNATQKVA